MPRLRRLLSIALVVAGLAPISCQIEAPAPEPVEPVEPPSIERVILVTIDTLRHDHLGYAGYPRSTTPFIDSLAARGIVFETAIAGSSHTGPSHATMLSGLYPPQHGVSYNLEGFAAEVPTMAGMLREAGFKTAGFTSVSFLKGLASGFDVFATNKTKPSFNPYQPATATTWKALAWSAELAPADRFFLWVHYYDPHQWKSDNKWISAEDVAAIRARSTLDDPAMLDFLVREHGVVPSWNRAAGGPLAAVDHYDAQILKVDTEIGLLHEGLRARGLLQKSLFIVTADHGEGLGSHDYGGHGERLFDEQIRVPLVFSFGDGRRPGTRIDRVVSHVDLLPTIADLTGLVIDRSFLPHPGRTLLGLIDGRDEPPRLTFSQRRPVDERRQAIGWEAGDVDCVRDQTHKYIHHSHADEELFDLASDRLELVDLIERDPATRERLGAARAALYGIMMAAGAGAEGVVDAEHIEELRSLGYLQ